MARPCPACGCPDTSPAHAVRAALLDGDVDCAIELGLLTAPPCPGCSRECTAELSSARDARRAALAARDRYRARAQRLERRERERKAARTPAPAVQAAAPALPPAAAAALARAKARAAGAPRS